MSKEKVFNGVLVKIDDQYERFEVGECFTGVEFTMTEEGSMKVANLKIPKKRANTDSTPAPNLTEIKGCSWGYYQNKRSVVYKMTVNDELFLEKGVDWAVERFRKLTTMYVDYLKKKAGLLD